MIGMLAFSKAGHDKGEIYMITGEDDRYVYLCDGRLKSFASPKKKSRKHIQVIKREIKDAISLHASIKERLQTGKAINNEEIKFVIKQFVKQQEVLNV